jgi:raffinose/stachyose/melibiose transport system permease protein
MTPVTTVEGTRRPEHSGTEPAVARSRITVGRGARAAGVAGRYLVTLLACAAYLVPLLFVVNMSLKTQRGYLTSANSVVSHPQLSNYLDAWREAAFGSLTGNSVLYALVCAIGATVLSLLVAFPVARGYVRGATWLYRLFVVSLFLPLAITTQFQLILSLHLYDTRLGYILLMTSNLGVGPFLVTGYLRALPRELDEAAAIDGFGYFRYLWRVVAPLCKPVLITAFLFQAINVWNDIINATIYLSDPGKQPITEGLHVFAGQYVSQVPLLASALLIVAFPLLMAYCFAQRFFVTGALGGAFKG